MMSTPAEVSQVFCNIARGYGLGSSRSFSDEVESLRSFLCCFIAQNVPSRKKRKIYRVGQKSEQKLMAIAVSNLNRISKLFGLEDSLVNLQ